MTQPPEEPKTPIESEKEENAEIQIKPVNPDEFEKNLSEEEIRNLDHDLNKDIEKTRSGLANKLLSLLISTYIGSFIILIAIIIYPVDNQEEKSEIYTYSKDIMTLLISTQTGLVGTALGFYFGSRR